MATPLADTLTQLRVGNQKSLIDFYQRSRPAFAQWAHKQFGLEPTAAHELLQDTLLDFYDQVADGRLTLLPADLRTHIYGMAQQRLAAAVPAHQPLPAAEASRRQHLLAQFGQLGTDCRKVLTFYYFHGYNAKMVGGKMGYANATVTRLQKASCLRKLYELLLKSGEPTENAKTPES
jgi:hypothetical protein